MNNMQTVTSKKKVLAMYSSVSRRCALVLALCSVGAQSASADHGRTTGSLAVSPSGTATYSVPIWTPPGPNGVQPSISVNYNSQGGKGLLGVGWDLSAGGSIERCNRTKHQDGDAGAIALTSSDRFCLNGNRLRLISGTYGAAGSVYSTEFADYSRITAYSAAGSGPAYFIVEAKNGLTYEYGNSTSSRVFPGVSPVSTTAYRWMLNKVTDRSGNSYTVTYNNTNGVAVPDVISWTPTSYGATSYRYEAKFNYVNNRPDIDSYRGRVSNFEVRNHYRLENIQIKSAGTVRRKYRFAYGTSSVTSRSRLSSITECADDAESNCLLPLTFSYQNGVSGVTAGAGSAPAGSSNSLIRAGFDFNGDGKEDIIYKSGSTWYVAFGANSGFAGPYSTGITGDVLPDRYLPNGRDAIATIVSGTLRIYRWNDATSAFVSFNTGIASDMPKLAADYNGDGLADLLYYTSGNPTLTIRPNTSTGSTNASFATSVISNTLASSPPNSTYWGTLMTSINFGQRRVDFNGDGRQDLYAVIVTSGPYGATQSYVNLLAQSTGYLSGSSYSAMTGPVAFAPALNFNGDKCTDLLEGTTVYISPCKGVPASTVSAPATAVMLLDFNGDGKTDILSNNGGTFRVYPSTGAGFGSAISTSIPSGDGFALDLDGDGLDDLIKPNGTGALSYWTHTANGSVPSYATNVPDLLSGVTDGYGVNHAINYVSTASSNYDKGSSTDFPLREAKPLIVVARLTSSDGIGSTYNRTYYYSGAREHAERGAFAGFQHVDETDSRTDFITKTYYDQEFPRAGMVRKVEVYQPNGTTLVSRSTITNSHQVLESDSNGPVRVHPYVSEVLSEQHEVGGTKNGALITTTQVKYENIDSNGNVGKITQTVTDNDTSLSPGQQWTTVTQNVFASPAGQCLDFLTDSTVTTTVGASTVVRTLHNDPDGSNCRIRTSIIEPSSTRYRVETVYGYDSFGNVNSVTVKGLNPNGTAMSNRVSTMSWGTLGLFPVSATNPLSQTTQFGYDYNLGLPTSTTDPNSLVTQWQYDAFGRKTSESRPDGSSTSWTYAACSGSCVSSRHKTTITKTESSGAVATAYLDQFDRVLVTRDELMNGSYQWNEQQYDARGRVLKQSIPCSTSSATASCVTSWVTNTYDTVGRIKTAARPISAVNSGTQTTTYDYAGRTTAVTDPQGRETKKISDPTGVMRVSTDANNYSQYFTYDAGGSLTSVTDSGGRSLFSASYEYGISAFQTTASDPDLGPRTQTYDSLGQLRAWTDAKGHAFTASYDSLSRMTSRVDPASGSQPAMTSEWLWGTNATNRNIGRLERMRSTVSGATYTDAYVYDASGRLSQRNVTIPGDATHTYDFTYTSGGLLDTVTYPQSTAYRLKLKYTYSLSNGQLQSVSDADVPATVFWTATSQNARGQITQDTLGNGIVRTRAYDAVTGWLSAIQAGPSGNTTALQNTSYLYDLVGNVTQRQNNRLGLTESFYYGNSGDSLYRLDHSTLTFNGTTTTNLTLSYDALGNILSKNEAGTHDAPVAQEIAWTSYNYPASITASTTGETAAFSYGPDRQRWKMVFSAGSNNETTYYIGGLMEKVIVGSLTDYRHYIKVGGESIAIYSRTSASQNTVRYVLSDHQGSIDTVASSSAARVLDESFTAYGLRRDASAWSGAPSSGDRALADGITRQGYTFQTVLGRMGLNHMNGRVQDAVIGRFVSPDPFVTEPGYTQNFNRYAYVYNNPLTNIDPSGFDSDSVFYCWKNITPGGSVAVQNGESGNVGGYYGFSGCGGPPPGWHPPMLPGWDPSNRQDSGNSYTGTPDEDGDAGNSTPSVDPCTSLRGGLTETPSERALAFIHNRSDEQVSARLASEAATIPPGANSPLLQVVPGRVPFSATTASGVTFGDNLILLGANRYDITIHDFPTHVIYGVIYDYNDSLLQELFPNSTPYYSVTRKDLAPFAFDISVVGIEVMEGKAGLCGMAK